MKRNYCSTKGISSRYFIIYLFIIYYGHICHLAMGWINWSLVSGLKGSAVVQKTETWSCKSRHKALNSTSIPHQKLPERKWSEEGCGSCKRSAEVNGRLRETVSITRRRLHAMTHVITQHSCLRGLSGPSYTCNLSVKAEVVPFTDPMLNVHLCVCVCETIVTAREELWVKTAHIYYYT